MRGAIFRNVGDAALEVVDDLETAPVAAGFVKVGLKATGVCHTELSVMNGTLPQMVPAVLGHEGAGEVLEVGDGVTGVAPGDHVIISWAPACGECPACRRFQPHLCMVMLGVAMQPRFKHRGEDVHALIGVGSFAEEAVVTAQSVVKIPDDVPFDVASLLGCGVMTGVGAAINTGRVEPGSSVVVYGCGGVGISVIQGARVCGAAEIVAVDLLEEKREQAKRFGATHAVHPDEIMGAIMEITAGEGFDYGFEAIGLSSTIRATYDAIRAGGTCVVVGAGRMDDMASFSAFEFFWAEKRLVGSKYGSANPPRDFDRILRLWRHGKIDLEGLITQKKSLDDINDALDDLREAKVLRTVIEF